jgi:hypothetical protein
MPTYTLRKVSTGEEWDVNCSFHELAPMLEDDDIVKVLSVPQIVSGVGTLQSKVPEGFRDKMKHIKSTSGRGNTIKV